MVSGRGLIRDHALLLLNFNFEINMITQEQIDDRRMQVAHALYHLLTIKYEWLSPETYVSGLMSMVAVCLPDEDTLEY